jgi:hypothetical protein
VGPLYNFFPGAEVEDMSKAQPPNKPLDLIKDRLDPCSDRLFFLQLEQVLGCRRAALQYVRNALPPLID